MAVFPWGGNIQRRKYKPWEGEFLCAGLNQTEFAKIRTVFEHLVPFGTVILREGVWPIPITKTQPALVPCDVFTLELDEPQPYVRIDVEAKESFAFALRAGKVVATGGQMLSFCRSKTIHMGPANWPFMRRLRSLGQGNH